jgi:hypothetical protein
LWGRRSPSGSPPPASNPRSSRAPESPTGRLRGRLLGLGYEIAERMGLGRGLEAAGYHILELRLICYKRRKLAGFGVAIIRSLAGAA